MSHTEKDGLHYVTINNPYTTDGRKLARLARRHGGVETFVGKYSFNEEDWKTFSSKVK